MPSRSSTSPCPSPQPARSSSASRRPASTGPTSCSGRATTTRRPARRHVLGLECSGDIVAVGDGVTDLQPGAHVCALLTGGGYAEYVSVPAGQVATVPEGITLTEAAGLMEVASTVWSNVFMMGKLQHGETLLVHGGGSGIGTFAIQLGKAFGAKVVVTVGSQEKAAFCRELGADLAINYREQDFAEVMTGRGDPRRRHPRHHRRQVPRRQRLGARDGRTARRHRHAGRRQGRAQPRCAADQAGRGHGDVAAGPSGRREGRDRVGDGRPGVAADRRRHRAPDHPRDLPPGGRPLGAPGDGGLHPHRQDPA